MSNLSTLFDRYKALVVFDTETSGLDFDNDQIIELAALRVERTATGSLRIAGKMDTFIKNKPAIQKAVTKTVQTLSDAASKSFTVTGYILSVILIDSVTKEQVIGDVSFENATASANGKVTVTLAAAPSNPILVIITSIAL